MNPTTILLEDSSLNPLTKFSLKTLKNCFKFSNCDDPGNLCHIKIEAVKCDDENKKILSNKCKISIIDIDKIEIDYTKVTEILNQFDFENILVLIDGIQSDNEIFQEFVNSKKYNQDAIA